MDAGNEHQRLDATPVSYLDEQGRYLPEQRPPDPPVAGDELPSCWAPWSASARPSPGSAGTGCGRSAGDAGSSAMTLGGMLKHLARFEDDMSAEWLRGRGQRTPWNAVDWDADNDWDWRTAAEDPPEQLYALWRDAVARSRPCLRGAGRGRAGAARRGSRRSQCLPSLRYVLLNMIEEYARHNGHADLIRESVDGLVGHDPPG